MKLATLLTAISLILGSTAGAQQRPNVVFILADDLGWSDTTLYGTTKFYQTPNIQRLAARGMTFRRAYSSSPLCSPTRASILTGLSPARIGITSPTCHLPKVVLKATPGTNAPPAAKTVPVNSATRFDTTYYTLAEALRDQGYATGHFGKWHLGHEPYSPLEHGFDVDVPHWPGPGPAGSYVAPWKFPDFDPDTPGEHLEDRMAKEAVAFMESHQQKPFFLNYWMFSVHAPFDAKQSLIEQHRARVDFDDPQHSPTYAAMIESMDDAVGTLLDTIDRLGMADRTIIVFASDNGGNMYNEVDGTTPTSNEPLRGGKATMYEGGVRGPCSVIWPGVVKSGSRSDAIVQSSDFYPTLLEMLVIKPQAGQKFDGVSIVPALTGQPLQRDAIFTYFPHAPRVPDWLPPAVSVHQGDWKLIRIFHGGENGSHRWKLFNLRNDIGEQRDLADSLREKVQQLDALIDDFLADTAAVLPTPNPNFNPDLYRPENEGKSTRKTARNPAPTATVPAQRVAGWQPIKSCALRINGQALEIDCNGPDPHLSYTLVKAIPPGEFELRLAVTSTGVGKCQFFWQEEGIKPAFFRDRSITFDVDHDGKPRDYRVKFAPGHPITAVRLDPGTGRGVVVLQSIKLVTTDGEVRDLLSPSSKRDQTVK